MVAGAVRPRSSETSNSYRLGAGAASDVNGGGNGGNPATGASGGPGTETSGGGGGMAGCAGGSSSLRSRLALGEFRLWAEVSY